MVLWEMKRKESLTIPINILTLKFPRQFEIE